MKTLENKIESAQLTSLTAHKPLIWLLIAFTLLATAYLWATPPLEASDELWHYGLVNYIANTGQIPVQKAGTKTAWQQEGSQPPLYYLIAAALIKPIDRGDFDAARQANPHAIAGVPGAVGNKNLVLHTDPHPQPQKTVLAVYLLRLFGIICGCITVTAVYASARLLVPDRTPVALLAASLTAFNPMFLFITASVNNDNLAIVLSSVVIWQTLILLRDGFGSRRSALLALLIALVALTKLSGLVLIPFVACAALWTAYRQRNWRGLAVLGLLILGSWTLIAGWWYLRNLSLYGEMFGTYTMAAVAGERTSAFTLQTLLNEFQGFRFTHWGVFGAVNIMTYRWFYDVADIVALLAIIGLPLYLRRSRDLSSRVRVLLLGLLLLLGIVGVVSWTSQTYASQGRLLFPYLGAISPLLALGLIELLTRITQQITRLVQAAALMALILGAFGLIVPFATIAPEYAPPAPLSALPDDAQHVYARFGDLALIGYQAPDLRFQPSDMIPVTVYWQVLAASQRDLSLYLHAVLSDGLTIGKVDSYPGAGCLRTTTWTPDAIYADTYAVPLTHTGEPSRLRIQVGWWDYKTGTVIQPTDTDGQALASVLLDAGGFADARVVQPAANIEPASADFGGLIRLQGYQLADDALTLVWDVTAPPPEDYTVFVQALDSAGKLVGQGDAPPSLPTHYWRSGERFLTHHVITYPQQPHSGDHHLLIGWYRPDDFTRLATESPDNAYVLATFTRVIPARSD